MRYCPNATCDPVGYMECEGDYCRSCGEELTPEIACLCGKRTFNPRLLPQYCTGCGIKVTEAYLGQCMSQQLKGMVREIVSQKAMLN